jgi:putative solute:sodium symporter small subunit
MDKPIPETSDSPRAIRALHWRQTRRMTALLLALWLLTGFCAAFFARELAGLSLFGWPLSFYLAAQGASLVYLAILAVYAWRMRRLDRAAGAALAYHKAAARQAAPEPPL